jgi:hypothetical protein
MNQPTEIMMPTAVSKNIIVQELEGELLIYNLQTHRAMSLNATTAAVWQACSGTSNLETIRAEASGRLHSNITEEMVLLALDILRQNKLLVNGEYLTSGEAVAGVSRRELIRRAAVSSAVALPVIIALAAPSAVSAGSNQQPGSLGSNCINDQQCQSLCCLGTCQVIEACFV